MSVQILRGIVKVFLFCMKSKAYTIDIKKRSISRWFCKIKFKSKIKKDLWFSLLNLLPLNSNLLMVIQ